MRMSNLHEKLELKKGPWTREEDQKMCAYIEEHGHGNWRSLPEKAGLQRCGKSCRLRWTNYLRPDITRGKFSIHEDKTIIRLHALLGNRWSAIAMHMPKRTDNEIKNYWNTCLKKRLTRMGIDPVTHKPKNVALTNSGQSKQTANLNHLTQWEMARLETEARLVRESKFLRKSAVPPPPRCLDVLKVWEANKNGFFDLTKTVQSPNYTSKDNYGHVFTNSSNSSACGVMEEESAFEELKGKMENLLQPDQDNNVMGLDSDFNYVSSPMKFIPDGDYNCFDTNMIWDLEKTEHCNELLHLVMSA